MEGCRARPKWCAALGGPPAQAGGHRATRVGGRKHSARPSSLVDNPFALRSLLCAPSIGQVPPAHPPQLAPMAWPSTPSPLASYPTGAAPSERLSGAARKVGRQSGGNSQLRLARLPSFPLLDLPPLSVCRPSQFATGLIKAH